jgi:hypothetical protein
MARCARNIERASAVLFGLWSKFDDSEVRNSLLDWCRRIGVISDFIEQHLIKKSHHHPVRKQKHTVQDLFQKQDKRHILT